MKEFKLENFRLAQDEFAFQSEAILFKRNVKKDLSFLTHKTTTKIISILKLLFN